MPRQPAPTDSRTRLRAIAEEALAIVAPDGDRSTHYGAYERESARIAAGWSQLLGVEVEPRMVPLMMIWLKISREANRHKHDNLVDVLGYGLLAADMEADE